MLQEGFGEAPDNGGDDDEDEVSSKPNFMSNRFSYVSNCDGGEKQEFHSEDGIYCRLRMMKKRLEMRTRKITMR